jgi:hypothetical protein
MINPLYADINSMFYENYIPEQQKIFAEKSSIVLIL